MKKIILSITVIAITIFSSCISEDFENSAIRDQPSGVLPVFTDGEKANFNLLSLSDEMSFTLNSGKNNGITDVTSGEIRVSIQNKETSFTKIADFTQLPFEYKVSLSDVLSTLNLNDSDITGGDIVDFKVYFKTPAGEEYTSANLYQSSILCPPVAGTYTIDMKDVYADGWQGGKIVANLDGIKTEIFMCDGNNDDCEGLASKVATYVVAKGSSALVWEFTGPESYPKEITFKITDPNGLVISEITEPSIGVITTPSTCPVLP
ncbi:hypothetical protein [Tenacibaculum finnmarkense]|uniref:hypothetical protein n=1 Tax=Tenacibaculum finnmarkense TaxID=2781243 RepID=UPI001E408836|nr:hypothetical protein [Tenacibaculum finnmarkense]MCD8399074.1 hypothetical protein [Tenacibaculum finnmarkense genomovar ulcerans]